MVDVEQNENNETRGTKPFLSQFIHTDAFRDLKPDEDPVIIDVGKKWSVEQLLPERKSLLIMVSYCCLPVRKIMLG